MWCFFVLHRVLVLLPQQMHILNFGATVPMNTRKNELNLVDTNILEVHTKNE